MLKSKCIKLLAVCALSLAIFSHAPVACSHASLIETYPEDQAALAQAPQALGLTFSEPVQLVSIQLINSSGQTTDDLRADNTEANAFTIPLAALNSGQYLVSYKVLSGDAHPVSGSFSFSVGETYNQASAARQTTNVDSAWRIAFIANRILHSVTLLLAIGAGLFVVLVTGINRLDWRLRTFGTINSWLALVTGILAIGLGGAQVVGGSLTALFSSQAWLLGGGTTIGVSVLLSSVGVIMLMLAYRAHAKSPVLLFLAGGLVAGISRTLTGHGAAIEPAWLVQPSVVIHFTTAAFWFGSLWPLLRILREESPEVSAAVLMKFSNWAIAMVAALLTAGLVLTVIQLGSFADLVESRYGQLLSFKLIGVLILLILALVNKQFLTPAVASGIQSALIKLQRAIRIEILLMVVVVILGLVIASNSPPAHQPAVRSETARQTLEEGNYTLELIVMENEPGQRLIELSLSDSNHSPLDILSIEAQWSLPAAGIEPLTANGEQIGIGKYRVSATNLVIPGQWLLQFDVLIDDFEAASFKTQLLIN